MSHRSACLAFSPQWSCWTYVAVTHFMIARLLAAFLYSKIWRSEWITLTNFHEQQSEARPQSPDLNIKESLEWGFPPSRQSHISSGLWGSKRGAEAGLKPKAQILVGYIMHADSECVSHLQIKLAFESVHTRQMTALVQQHMFMLSWQVTFCSCDSNWWFSKPHPTSCRCYACQVFHSRTVQCSLQ